MSMRHLALALIALVPWGAPAADVEAPAADLRFTVYLDDTEIGEHRFRFEPAGDGYVVDSRARMSVDFLFFTAYRYRHHSRERWDSRCLESIDARTEDGGTRYVVEGERLNSVFVVQTEDARQTLRGCVRTFAYWDPGLLRSGRLLNAQTGEYLEVEVERLGEKTIDVRGEAIEAQHRRITGPDLRIDLWHSAQGEWLALESRTDSGTLRYRLQSREARR